MTPAPSFRPSWLPREPPLNPIALAGIGAVAEALLRRLLRLDDSALASLSGVRGPGLLLILGEESALPWVDDAVWLGRDPAAPSLLLPTAWAPAVPLDLYERAVRARALTAAGALAVLPRPGLLVPTGAARPLDRAGLQEVEP